MIGMNFVKNCKNLEIIMKALFLTPHSFLGFSGGTIATKNFLNIVRAVFNNNVTVVAEENSNKIAQGRTFQLSINQASE